MGINNSCTGCESTEPTVAEVNALLGNLKDCAGAPLEIGDRLINCEVFDAAVEDLNDAIAAEEAARIAGDAATLASALAADKDYVDCSGTAIADGAALATCANLNTAVATEQAARVAGDAATLASALAADKDYVDCSGTAIADGAALATCANLNSAIAAIPPNPTTLPPSGAAGGSLAGTYPNPTFNAAAFTASFDTNFASKNASPAQAVAGTDNTVFSSPADVKAYIDAQFATLADMLAGTNNTKIVNPKDVYDTLSTAQDYTLNVEGTGQNGRLIRAVSTGGSRPAIAADTRPSNTSLNTVNFTKLTGDVSDPIYPAVACNGSILHFQGDGYPVPSANVHTATAGNLEIQPVVGVDRIAAHGHLGHISFPGNLVAGVYGSSVAAIGAYSGFTQYAGYFNGNVFTTGLYLPSDETVKRNVKEVGKSGKLDVISYDLTIEVDDIKYVPQTNEKGEVFHVVDKENSKKAQLGEKNKIGYKAEQVALVYPDAIKRFDDKKIAVDYVQVLVHQLLELNERTEKLENTIYKLEERLAAAGIK